MAKDLPYFRWYAGDAETDEFYQSLSYEEKGVYHALLNKAWINNGIPAEIAAIASLLQLSARNFLKIWPKISQKWERRGDRFFNPRQEEERGKALAKSEKNKRPGNANATREKRDRDLNANETERVENAIAPQQARARADSDSASFPSSSEKGSAEGKSGLAIVRPGITAIIGQRFSEWIRPWQRNSDPEAALHAFAFCWTPEEDEAIFACRDRYLASKDVADGVWPKPENFLNQQKQVAWTGKWPAARDPPRSRQGATAEDLSMLFHEPRNL